MKSLEGQTAFITGATSGIGKAVAVALAEQGVRLFLTGRNAGALQAIATQVALNATAVDWHAADLSSDDALRELVDVFRQRCAALHILIHSAGMIRDSNVEDGSAQDFDQQYKLNLRAPYVLCQELVPMLRSAGGQVVFMNSSAALQARPGIAQYAATKHALMALADSLREEVNPDGVRVLSVFIGQTATPMQEALYRKTGKPYRPEQLLQPEDIASMVVAALLLPRTAEATAIHIRPMQKP